MKINNIEYGGQFDDGGIGYTIPAGTQAGDAVTLVGAGQMGRGAADAPFCGKLTNIDKDGRGTVHSRGVLVVPCVVGLTPGYKGLQVDGAGKVKAGASNAGRQALVIGVQEGMAAIEMM